ncbi:MAG: dienelactone hydrolase family protein [Parcubacteria group bacterium]
METIKLTSPEDGFEFTALHAEPEGARKGGVIVLQEIFGLDEYVQADVQRWADAGYEAVAPSLFDRRERGFTAGHDDPGFAAGREHAMHTPLDQALADIAACRDFLAAQGPVFVVGYCYGGSLTWIACGRLGGLAAGSSYYGSLVKANAALTPKCPVIVHLGRKDAHIPADEVKAAVEAAQPGVPVYIYETGDHGFNNEGSPRYDQASAELARRRTRELFEANA